MDALKEWTNIDIKHRPKVRYWIPAAAVDENDLRREIRELCERGFGGVEIVVLFTTPDEILGGEYGWGTEKWNETVAVIADETRNQGMTFDLAIGPAWPIASPVIKSVNDAAAATELTYGIADVGGSYCGALPERRKIREEGDAELVAVSAYKYSKNALIISSYKDMMPYVKDGVLNYTFDGEYKLFAFYCQPTAQKVNMEQTYVVDHLSKAGAQAVKDYWETFFERFDYPSLESLFCDSLEYHSVMDWTRGFEKIFEKERGYSIIPFLPVVALDNIYPECDATGYTLDDETLRLQVQNDYLEVLNRLHIENHLKELDSYAKSRGKSIRYQVAYNKPFQTDRCALAVELPENEALGRSTFDYMKNMASAVHLGKKRRHSFECAAEVGHAYGQSYEDLFWWIKRSYIAGMFNQVMHGASYSGRYGYAPYPGYEGFGKGISNNWNRTPDISHARGCLDAIARLNTVFSKKAEIDCAVYRPTSHNDGIGGEFCLYPDNGALMNLGYSYEFVSDVLLSMINGEYRCLIIPEQELVSADMLKEVKRLLKDIPVVWVGKKPYASKYRYENVDIDGVFNDERIIHAESLGEVPELIPVKPRISLDSSADIATAYRVDGDDAFFALYAYNRAEMGNGDDNILGFFYKKGTVKETYERPDVTHRIKVSIETQGDTLCICNPFDNSLTPVKTVKNGGRLETVLDINEDEMIVLKTENVKYKELSKSVTEFKLSELDLYSFEPDTPDETSFLRSHFENTPIHIELNELQSWRKLDSRLEKFGGKGVYKGSFTLGSVPERCILALGRVCDTFTVKVNGKVSPYPDQVMKRADLTGLVKEGENTIEIEVVSNLYNKLQNEGDGIFDLRPPYVPRDYGITGKTEIEIYG